MRRAKFTTVRYDAVNAMLLNEFLKEHSKVQEQQATIAQLESTVAHQKKDLQTTVAQLTARLDEQATQIQKVSAQLQASKRAPQVVNNPWSRARSNKPGVFHNEPSRFTAWWLFVSIVTAL
jgi:septal ring factor EnvC (AmiA/AmiB activator)